MVKRFLGTCKHCKATVAVDAEREAREVRARPFPRTEYRYHVRAGRMVGASSSWAYPGAIVAVCACGQRFQLEAVKGVLTSHVCDPRCTSATGHKCECACGGANHGQDHAA